MGSAPSFVIALYGLPCAFAYRVYGVHRAHLLAAEAGNAAFAHNNGFSVYNINQVAGA